MKIFLFKISLVILVIVSVLVITDKIYTSKAFSSAPENDIDFLVMGDSHTQTAVRDGIIRNFFNSSHESENYFYTYYKILFYLKSRRIKNIILGVSDHNFSSMYDALNCNEKGTSNLYHKYIPILDFKGKLKLFILNPVTYIDALKETFKYEINYFLNGNTNGRFPWDGEPYERTSSNLSDASLEYTFSMHYLEKNGSMCGFSSIQLEYLRKIINLCDERKINLLLLKTPLHEKYRAIVPEKFRIYFDENIKTEKIKLLDFSEYYLPDDMFGDADHLNVKGAEKFTLMLNDTLTHLCGR